MSKAKTPADREKAKQERVMNIRPRVGSSLALVRASVEEAGGNMTTVIHDLADKHKVEIIAALNGPAEIPGFD